MTMAKTALVCQSKDQCEFYSRQNLPHNGCILLAASATKIKQTTKTAILTTAEAVSRWFSPWSSVFSTRAPHVGFVVDKVAMGQV
jgi:hypothetical protein